MRSISAYTVWVILLALTAYLVTAAGHQYSAVTGSAQPHVIMEVLDLTLAHGSDAWKTEIGRRFDNALGIMVHGGAAVDGEWIVEDSLTPDHLMQASDIVKYYQKLYPTRVIVLLACNPGHLKLGIPGVYYSPSETWIIPDRALTASDFGTDDMATLGPSTLPSVDWSKLFKAPALTRWELEPDVVGNVWELTTDP